MEFRGGKGGDKLSRTAEQNPDAPSRSQHGDCEDACGSQDLHETAKRLKGSDPRHCSVSSAVSKLPEEQPILNFQIPRKNREKRALFQYLTTDSREYTDLLQIITSSYKDSSSMGMFEYSKPRLVHSEQLEKEFMEKRKELKQDGRTEKELSESFCFLLCEAPKVQVVCEKGLSVGSSWMNMLGNPSKGVYLCQFSDLLHITPMELGSTGNIIIFKVIKGKVKSVHDSMSRSMDPTPKFDSHFAKNATRVTSLQSYRAFEFTQQYFYEYVDFEISSRPRHVCPYAVVTYQFKSKEASTPTPKPLPPIRSNSQPSGTNKGRRSYTVWRGHFVNGGKDMYQACIRSLGQPFLPFKMPEKIEIGKVMSLDQVKRKIPAAIFSWKLYTGSHEVSKGGMFCSLFEVVEKDKSPNSLATLMQKLEEEGLVLVNMVNNRGFLFLLSASQMSNSDERRNAWKTSSIQALFIYREKRDTLNNSSDCSDMCEPLTSEPRDPIMPQHQFFITALHYALNKARSDPPADLSTSVEQQVYNYLTKLCEGKILQRIKTDYDSKLDARQKLFPAPRKKTNMEAFLRSYIFNPSVFTMVLENVKKKVEDLGIHTDLSAEQMNRNVKDPQNDPEKVKELLKLIQNKKNTKGGKLAGAGQKGAPDAVQDPFTLKRKMESESHEGLKRQRGKLFDEDFREDEMQSSPTLADVLNSAGLQDTDLRKNKTQGALKVMEMLGSLGKTTLDTDLRRDKAQGALEVIRMLDSLTRAAPGSSDSPGGQESKENTDISEAALFDSMLRLGLPTDRDIDLRKRFVADEPERSDCLEDETAGSMSSLEAFSPCSDSGGPQRGANVLGEKSIPWVLIPITGLKTERYSQRQMDYPEDPRFLQSPTVSTHSTPEVKELSPPYQPDSSNLGAEPDVQPVVEVEDQDNCPAVETEAADCHVNDRSQLSGVDHIVDEQISGFSGEVEELLREKRIYYVSCSSTHTPRGPPWAPIPPLSEYVSHFNTPIPVSSYISSFHESMMMFIDSQNSKQNQSAHALHVSSSSSALEVPSSVSASSSNSNPCTSSSPSVCSTKPNHSSDSPCSPTSTLPIISSSNHITKQQQQQHEPSLPQPDSRQDNDQLPQNVWGVEQVHMGQNTLIQQSPDANVPNKCYEGQALHDINGCSVVESTATKVVEEQMTKPIVMDEDVKVEHTHSSLSSIIDQLQPDLISNLVEIIKGVQKNSVHFYIHSLDEEESDVCWEIKEYLKKLGDVECDPHSFLEKKNDQDKLLVIIQNMDIAAQVHKIPALVSLKKLPCVSFAGVDSLDDLKNHTYNELFQSGGFIVSDEYVLNPDVITPEKLQDVLQYIEQLNTPQNPWRWRVHFKSHKKLREQSRFKSDALNLYEILTAFEKRHVVEILSYHDCDAPSHRAPDLDCLVDLQARFVKQRHLIFLTGCRFEMFPHYSSSGIAIANIDDIKFIISSLNGGVCENVDNIPSSELHASPSTLRDDAMSMDSEEDSPAKRPSVPFEMTHVITDQHRALTTDLYPAVSEPSCVQEQATTVTLPTVTCEAEKELDFKALSEAISQFKASRMQANSKKDEEMQGSFRLDPHQSFLSRRDLPASFLECSLEENSLPSSVPTSEQVVSCTQNQMQSLSNDELNPVLESAVQTTFTGVQLNCGSAFGSADNPVVSTSENTEIASAFTAPVEANSKMYNTLHETVATNPAFSTAVVSHVSNTATNNSSNISNSSKPFWDHSIGANQSMGNQTRTNSGGSKGDFGPRTGASEMATTRSTTLDTTRSSEPPFYDNRETSGLLPTPANSGYGMDNYFQMDQMVLQRGGLLATPHQSMGLSCPTLVSQNGAIGLRHPLLNCTVSSNLGVPVLRGLMPNHNIQMAWNSLAQGVASGIWGVQPGMDVRQIHRPQFFQTWHGNPALQGNYRPNRGGFNGW